MTLQESVEDMARRARLGGTCPDPFGVAVEILKHEPLLEEFDRFVRRAHPRVTEPPKWKPEHFRAYALAARSPTKRATLGALAQALVHIARLQGREETYEIPPLQENGVWSMRDVLLKQPLPSVERDVLVDFSGFLGRDQNALDMLGAFHFEQYLRRRLRRGEPVETIHAVRRALHSLASIVGRSQEYYAAEGRIVRALRLTRRGPCWVLEPYFRKGARTLDEAALARHGANLCAAECLACVAGVPNHAWWTMDVTRLSHLRIYADSETYAAYRQEQRRVREESFRLSSAVDVARDIPAPPGREYFPFQKAGIVYALSRRATLIGDEMGLGKTIQALGVINADPSLKSVLVVCPATLLANWRQEAERWLVRPFKFHVCEDNSAPPADAGMVIVSYGRLAGPLRAHLLERPWELLVADEAHYVKNADARRTRALFGTRFEPGILKQARRILFLTGTPILNHPSELLTLVRALDPVTFTSEKVPSGFDAFQRLLRETVLVRRLKSEVLPELPPKRRSVIVLPRQVAQEAVSEERRVLLHHAQEIRTFAEALAATVGDPSAYAEAARRLSQARIEAQGGIFRARHLVALAKLPAVLQHCDALLEDGVQKVVIWAHHRDVIESISDHFGASAVALTGETSLPDRGTLVRRFQSDPNCHVFVGSMRTAGQGITLTAADHIVFAELDWTPAILAQAEDRCHRIGQRESLLIQHLVVDDSIDAHLVRKIVQKQAMIRQALDSPRPDDGKTGLDWALQAA
jgi:SWI/SNF-related matrix-associated actin-dependent regulator 1 of chromatin subfamily A